MAAGIPVVTTSVGALPEVTGDAALLVAPDDRDELAQSMWQALNDDELRSTLIERGRVRAGQFSWRAAADQFGELYRRLA
jgi:glycosyltransferase involved in cell wall biosynthesis